MKHRGFVKRQPRSLVKRSGIPLADASGSYTVQHLPEWMAKTGFDFARRRDLPAGPADRRQGFRFDDTSLESVLRHIGPSDRVRACKGYFPQTASAVQADEPESIVRLPDKSGTAVVRRAKW